MEYETEGPNFSSVHTAALIDYSSQTKAKDKSLVAVYDSHLSSSSSRPGMTPSPGNHPAAVDPHKKLKMSPDD